MFIQTEETPNPATLKFLPGCDVTSGGVVDVAGADAAGRSPLASRLFSVPGVVSVMLGPDFVAVTKASDADWMRMRPHVLGALMDHFQSGQPALDPDLAGAGAEGAAEAGPDAEIIRQIKELLDTRVRPAVARDGGDITFHSFHNGVVHLHMRGACSGCPSSTATLKMGVENLLRHFIPEVVEVRAIR